jgi:hypothetical protein
MHADQAEQVATQMITPLKARTRPLTLENFPERLKAYPRWVLWRLEERAGKLTKVPYQLTGMEASSMSSVTWSTYADVVSHLNDKVASVERTLDGVNDYTGVGTVLVDSGGIVFLDLDHCVNPDGSIDGWAREIVDQLNSYTELSPSRTGLHIWVRGDLPLTGRKKGSLEMYSSGRYATVTGWQLSDTPSTISACDLTSLHARMMAGKFIFTSTSKPVAPVSGVITIKDKFSYLQAGKWQEAGYASRSEADAAFCRFLSHDLHTYAEIDAAFRKSDLMRSKWDEKHGGETYGERTIRMILESPQKITPAPAPVSAAQIISYDSIPDPRALSSAPVRCLVDGFIPANQLVIIAGEYGTGKTWLGMMLGNAVARGERFLGRDTIQQRVIYFDRENPLPVIKERMVALFGEQDEPNYRHWGLWLPDDPPNFGDARYLQFACSNTVLIFDSFTRFHTGSENSPTEMAQISGHLRKLQSAGATVIVLHHRDKKLEAAYRGTAEIAAGCDVLYSFSRETQADKRTLKQIKSRTALDDTISFRVDWDLPALTPADNPQLAKRRQDCAAISAMLRDQPEGMQQRDIIERMEQQGISRSQTQRHLDANEGKLWISRGGGHGVPKTYHPRIVIK